MLPKYKNNSFATLNGSHSAGSDTLSVDSTTLLPTITAGQFFYVTVWNRATHINPGEDPLMEVCKVTGVTGSTLTLEAVTANPHGSGSMVAVLLTDDFFKDLETEFDTHTHDYIPTTQKAAVNGVATLDANGKVPLEQTNDAILGQVEYCGLWNAATNSPTLNALTPERKGNYYITSAAGSFAGLSFQVGDWIISNGTSWDKVNNTDAVSTVFGRTGNVTAQAGDYTAAQVGAIPTSDKGAANGVATLDSSGYVPLTQLSSAVARQGQTSNGNDTYINRTFSVLENASLQYWLLCENAGNNNVNGTIHISRTSGNYQAATLDIVISSTTTSMRGGALRTLQVTQDNEKYELVLLTNNGDGKSYVAIKYHGINYPYTRAFFTGMLQSTAQTLVAVTDVSNVVSLSGTTKANFDVESLMINESPVLHAGDKDVIDGVTALNSNGDLIVPSDKIFLDMNGANHFYISERRTNEQAFMLERLGANNYFGALNEGGVYQKVLTESRMNVANGVAALDSNGKVPLTQIPDTLTGKSADMLGGHISCQYSPGRKDELHSFHWRR